MTKVLVTGAAGFIGNKILNLFKEKGYVAYGWDCLEVQNVEKINLLDESFIIERLKLIQPDIIIHCAGSADVGKSVQFPELDYQGNVTITHNLMFALHKLGMENTRVVFLSSAGVYGNPLKLPITETTPVNPLSPYALHKVMCENICFYFHRNYGMNVKIARIFSAYGAGLRKQIFWDMCNKFEKTGQLEMFGTGNESRDYIHVDDLIQALYLLTITDSQELVFNIANGEEITIRQATEWFAKFSRIDKSKILFNGQTREGEPLNWRADNSRILQLGYKKSIDMEQGIQEYVDWLESK